MPRSDVLVLRADGGVTIGAGHVMRMVALAQAWQEVGGRAILLSHKTPVFFSGPITNSVEHIATAAAPASPEDAAFAAAITNERGAEWLVVDGYTFGHDFVRSLEASHVSTVVLDDAPDGNDGPGTVILNPNVYASHDRYPKRYPEHDLLVGPRYALLRREFREGRWHRHYRSQVRSALVLVGASMPSGLSEVLREGLDPLVQSGVHVDLVLGRGKEQDRVRRWSRGTSVVVHDAVANVASAMFGADLTISAAGTTAGELAATGTPMILVAIAENQIPVATAFAQRNAAINLGPLAPDSGRRLAEAASRLSRSATLRRRLGRNAQSLIDAQGAARVAMFLRDDPIRLRPATDGDVELLWNWANDPGVRAASIHRGAIPFVSHREWLRSKLADPRSRMFVAVDRDDRPVGQIRFDRGPSAEAFTIDVSVDRALRGQGLGNVLIEYGSMRIEREFERPTLTALVREGNVASRHAFVRSGFAAAGTTIAEGDVLVRYVRAK